MKVLLFGGSGRLGTAIRRHWSVEIIAPNRVECDPLNPTQVQDFIQKLQPDILVNCIAYNQVDAAEGEGKDEANLLNTILPTRLAHCAKSMDTRLIHFSTDYVFDGILDRPYQENDLPNPINEYGRTKLAGEHAILSADPSFQIVRTSRLYGASAESTNAKKSFVDIVRELATTQKEFLINHGEVGSPTWVNDLACHVEEYVLGATSPRGILHLTNESGVTWFEWATEIVHDLGLSSNVLPRDPSLNLRPAKRPPYSVLTSTKIPPMRSWKDALKEFLKNY